MIGVRIQIFFPVFSPNAGKCGARTIPNSDTFHIVSGKCFNCSESKPRKREVGPQYINLGVANSHG